MSVGIDMKGRQVTLTVGGQSILGIQSKGLTVNNEFIETTDDNANGWQEFAAIPGQKAVELPFSGMVKNLEVLRSIMGSGSQIYACTLTYPDGTTTNSTVTGDFAMQSYTETGEYNGGYTFEVTLASSGEVTFTPAT